MHIAIVEDAARTARLSLKGNLNIVGADEVAVPLAALSQTKSGLLIDMVGVTFLTAAGIRQLIAASTALSRRGGRLVLLKPNETVIEVLSIAGVRDLMTIAQSEADAAAALH